jgi:predicted kinase
MSTLYIPVGIPASGKDYLAQQMVQAKLLTDDAILSPDNLRAVLTGDIANQTVNGDVFGLINTMIAFRNKYKQDVYLSATNLQPSKLYPIFDKLWSWNTVIIWMDTPDEVSLQRNLARERTVPEGAMQKMIARKKSFDIKDVLDRSGGKLIDSSDMLERCYGIIFGLKQSLPFPEDTESLPDSFRDVANSTHS